MNQEYYMGLDMGTGSLGWAITDTDYHILRRHGKALWGVRLFESALTAEERRSFRIARRRLDRRNWRIQILQELFSEEISKVDLGFFQRMKESKYYPEDKKDINGKCPELPYALFVDKNYTDKEYHREYPTIYHLRKMLMETEEMPDIRLVYLGLHHMMKHRGHFLLSGDISKIKEFKGTFLQLEENLKKEELNWTLELSDDEIQFIENTLKDRMHTKSVKKSRLIKQLNAKTTCEKAILNLISGGSVKLSDIFENSELDGCENPKISFSDTGYDDYIGTVEADLVEQYYIIESAKAVYDWSVLVEILGDSSSISEAKVKLYEKHKADLRYLKKIVRKYLPLEYKHIFIDTEEKLNNYVAYIGMTKKNGKKNDLQSKKCSKEEFYDFLKKNVIKKISDQEVVSYLEKELEQGTFLPKQVNKENSVIPYQVHMYELRKILDNLSGKSSFMQENKEKILQLFEFRIPYYVGPLGRNEEGTEGKFTWAVRKNNEKIYPWNFKDVIDIEESAEKFIRRMTNKCTYMLGEDVLPKDSLLYSKYMVLNELNNLRLNGEKISVELKQRLYKEVFCCYRKVTIKKLKNYLIREGIVDKNVEITGIDGDFKAQLTAFHDFKEKLTGVTLSQKEKEEIILNIVLFGDDKKLLKQRVMRMHPELTEKQIKSISMLSYKGWGRLSKAFLENITTPAPGTEEVWNVITAMWETNDNLMQILSKNYQFMDRIEEYNSIRKEKNLSYKTVDELYVSPAVKRQIWQTLKVVKELQKVMECAPKRVFVEMARGEQGNQKDKRRDSRKKQLIDLYKKCKEEERDWIEELNKNEDQQLRSDKLYLYYTQKGRCMYSGEIIQLEDLWDNTKYDIDHIYPQSKTMDDSLNNRVLVKKEYNAAKSDEYPIKGSIRKARKLFWKSLLDEGFITKEKYERLIRNTALTPDELAGFINRQLVETRQSTKAVAEILKQVFPDSEIVYVKAKNVSEFRQDFTPDLLKVRDMNDLHHAKDAYLNIVVGNSYYTKFTKNAAWFIKENPGRSYNLKMMFKGDKDIIRNGEVAWKAGNNGTIVTVKNVMKKNNILVTRRTYEVKGGLFKQQPIKKGKGQLPLKESDNRLNNLKKYGGYTEIAGSYYLLVKSIDKKGKIKKTIEYIPIYLRVTLENNKEKIIYYLKERGLINPQILLKIKTDTLFKINGSYIWISGRKTNYLIFKNANQLVLENTNAIILKNIIKFLQRKAENKNLQITHNDKLGEKELCQVYDVLSKKLEIPVYSAILMSEMEAVKKGREKFIELSREEQCNTIKKIFHIMQCRSARENLREIGGGTEAGRILINKNIDKYKQISIINQSPTGIYEEEIDLLKL